jgi:UPF0042 nucleotide-binding protein
MPDSPQDLLILTGMSGSGRSTAAKSLEDMGWYVVDNLPPAMLRPLIELASAAGSNMPRIAAVFDVRTGSFFSDLKDIVASLRDGTNVSVVFLDATDAALVRRFESVRRPHPLQGDGTILDGIEAERIRLADVREYADVIIDTSDKNIHQLSTTVSQMFAGADQSQLRVTVQSFGFKYGTPTDVDIMADARFLPNPFWEADLGSKTGLDPDVSAFVMSSTGAVEFLDAYTRALEPVWEGFQRENKRHVTLAIGCTGGKHRSVALVESISVMLRDIPGLDVSVKHRDLGRE